MEFINSFYETEYLRWKNILSDITEPEGLIINIDDVLKAHFFICDYFFEVGDQVEISGPKDKNLLLSAIMRPLVGFDGFIKWKDMYEQVATLFYGLVMNHPFHDGNKRTAILITLFYLYKMKRWPTVSQKKIEEITISTACNKLESKPEFQKYQKRACNIHDRRVYFIADFLKCNTRKEDHRIYLITYRQLNTLLREHNIELKHPEGNHINVIKYEEKRKGFFGSKTILEKRIARIGFPGWTKEICNKDIDIVREAANLTPEKGIDSQVFFKHSDPMPAIISHYHKLIYRLRDK